MHSTCFSKVLSPYMSLVYKSLPGSHTGTWGVARALEAGTGCWGFYCLKYLSHFYMKIEKVLVIMEKGAEMTELRRDSLPLGPGPFLGGSPTRCLSETRRKPLDRSGQELSSQGAQVRKFSGRGPLGWRKNVRSQRSGVRACGGRGVPWKAGTRGSGRTHPPASCPRRFGAS